MANGIARAGFDIDLRDGKAREDAFAYVVLRARVEVKSDQIARRTGNVFVEYQQKGRPSGIATTEADWWAFEVNDDCFVLVPTERVKLVADYVMANCPDKRKDGGDYNMYKGVAVPVNWLLQMRLTTQPVARREGADGDR